MRHIPDDELHAYLDQALSRSQCVEIECHLAECIRCRHDRDLIAALRDRTTALLGSLVPQTSGRPRFAALMLQANTRRVEQAESTGRADSLSRWSRRGAQAAGVALLIAVGWSARGLSPAAPGAVGTAPTQLADNLIENRFGVGGSAFTAFVPAGSSPVSQTPQPVANTEPEPGWEPDPIERTLPPRRLTVAEAPGIAPMALTVSSLDATSYSAEFPAPGVWRTVSWTEAAALTGDVVPRIHDMPVIEIQVQLLGADERPMVMVAHQDPSGRIIRSIEGPADRLGAILSDVIARTDGAVHTSRPIRTIPDYVSGTSGATRRSIRVAAIAGYLEASALDELTKSLTIR